MKRALALALLASLLCPVGPLEAADVETLVLSTAEREGKAAPGYLKTWMDRDREWGARHRVLVQMAAGRIAFLRGDWPQAEALLADAQHEVESIYADNPQAKAARSVFVPEATKDFKGDPYERAMLGIYLGLIDLSHGDFDNARAGFRFAQLQDTMSAAEQYQDDMALAQYLVGWSYWCEGQRGNAAEEFERARKLRPDLLPPQAGDDVLMLAELGAAPIKFRSGQFGELQRMRAGAPSPMQQVAFRMEDTDGQSQLLQAAVAEDLLFQASTRGGAAVDSIRAGKASFRSGAETLMQAGGGVSTLAFGAATVAASTGRDSRELAGVGVVAGLVAMAAKGVASSTETLADVRYWPNLPEKIYLRTAKLPPGQAVIETGFYSFSGKVQQGLKGQLRMSPRRECALYISQSQDATSRFDRSPAARWPALPSLKPAPGLANLEYLIAPDIGDEGESLLDSVRKTRETPR